MRGSSPDFISRYPATKSFKDIQQACPAPFPSLPTDPGGEFVFVSNRHFDANLSK